MIYNITCKLCGTVFETTSGRAQYCVDCRKKRQIERNKEYLNKKKTGNSRQVGSTDICPLCNNEYVITSGSQLCCEDCRHKQTNKRKSVNNNKYKKKTYDTLQFLLPIGERQLLHEYAAAKGFKSFNDFMKFAIEAAKKELDK